MFLFASVPIVLCLFEYEYIFSNKQGQFWYTDDKFNNIINRSVWLLEDIITSRILICGDSFAADWTVKYTDQTGWPNLLANKYTVTNIAQAAVSEYKILQQVKSADLTKFDTIIISHASPNRIHCQLHPVHSDDILHGDSDLIYNDLKDRSEVDAILAVNYFKRYFELDYYTDVAQLLCKEILTILGQYPHINQFHMVNFANNDNYDFLPSYNINTIFSKHAGLMNHFNDQGNKKMFDKIDSWLQDINQV
jgi:hypothetical protein